MAWVMIFLTILLSLVHTTYAVIVINEVAIHPTQTVELLNTASTSADISGWFLDDSGGSTYYSIPYGTIIPPFSCSVFSSNFNFNTASTDTVRLFNSSAPPTSSSANLVDSYTYVKSPQSGFSFARNPDMSTQWGEYSQSFGQWNTNGSSCLPPPSPTPTPAITPINTPTVTPTSVPDYDGISIVEVYPAPKTGESEWVRIKNENDVTVSLIDWYIDDLPDSGAKPLRFSATIHPYDTYVVSLASGMLNNSGDTVRILNAAQQEKDMYTYTSIAQGMTVSSQPTCTPSPFPTETVPLAMRVVVQPQKIPRRRVTIRHDLLPSIQKPFSDEPVVLGVSSEEHAPNPNPLLLIPAVFSTLTIVSLFIKMRYARISETSVLLASSARLDGNDLLHVFPTTDRDDE